MSPGSALYLPPRFPHHGIATSPSSATLSIGYRTPSVAGLAALVAEKVIEGLGGGQVMLGDGGGEGWEYEEMGCGFIDEGAMVRAAALLEGAVVEVLRNGSAFGDIYARVATGGEGGDYPPTLEEVREEMGSDVQEVLGVWGDASRAVEFMISGDVEGRGGLYWTEGVTFGYTRTHLYGNGRGVAIPDVTAGRMICENEIITRGVIAQYGGGERMRDMLVFLVEQGLLCGSNFDEGE